MAESAPARSPEGEAIRTFLFADIRGYTRFTVEHGDAAAARFIERFGSVARSAITARHGEILTVVGDEAVAAFISAREALRAALDLQAGVEAASASDPSTPLQVGVGLDTGEAIRTGGSFAGAALNLAARLCQLAGPSEILASDGVVHVARKLDGVGYFERGLVQLKGFQEPVRVFRILAETGETTVGAPGDAALAAGSAPESILPIGAFLGALPSTPLVARDSELERLLHFADAIPRGAGRVVMLSGEPGVGKTRLAQELTLSLRNRQFLVVTGRCYQQQQSVPYYPFLDALSSAYRSAPNELRATVPARWPFLCRLLPDLHLASSSTGTSTPEEQQTLFREVTGFLKELAGQAPLGVLLDDLHWADTSSLELFLHLARHLRADRVLLAGTYRDVEVGRHHPLEGALRDLTREDLVDRIPIRRLEAGGTAQLVAATLGEGSVSTDLDAVIHQHAGGNPFFTQQLVRFLVERGDVSRVDGRWVERPHHRLEVPESIRSVIGQRMERLPTGAQEILREAAVLGQTFPFDSLVELSGRPVPEVEAALEEARSIGLVDERQPDRYAFDHALTQQTLYGELSSRKRRKLHVAAAESLVRLPEPERRARSAELAWHYLEAAQEEKAIPYALAAGDLARSVYALKEAERQYNTVLDIAEQFGNLPAQVEALTRRAKLEFESFRGKESERDYARLLGIAERQHDRHLELPTRVGLAQASYIVALDDATPERLTQCRSMLESAIELARELGDRRAQVDALLGTRYFTDFWPEYHDRVRNNIGEALRISRELADEELILRSELASWKSNATSRLDAEAASTRLVQQLRDRHDYYRLNSLYFTLMWVYLDWAEFERAVEVCDAGIRVAHEIGVPPVQYSTLKALAFLALGEFGRAWDSLQEEVTDPDHPFGQAMQTLGMGIYYFELQQFATAADTFRDLLVRAKELHRAWMLRWGAVMLARSLVRLGQLDPENWNRVEEQLREVGAVVPADLRAEIHLSRGEPEPALEQARAAAQSARTEESAYEVLLAQELEVRALLKLGRPREAVELADQVLRELSRIHALSVAWRLMALRAQGLTLQGDEVRAAPARAEAAATARAVGDTVRDAELRQRFFSSPVVAFALRSE